MNSIGTFVIIIMGHEFSICPGITPIDVFSELSDWGVMCSKYGVYKGKHRQQTVRQKSLLCGSEDLPDDKEVENGKDSVAAGDPFTNASELEPLPEPLSIVNEYEFPRTFSRNLHACRRFEKVPRHDDSLENNGGMELSENKSTVLTPISITTFEKVRAISEIQRSDGTLQTSSSSADFSVDSSPAHDIPPVFVVCSNLEEDVIQCKEIHCLSIDGENETVSQNKNSGAVMSHDENPIRPSRGIFFLGPEDTEDRLCAYVGNNISKKLGYVHDNHQQSRDCLRSHSVSDRLSSDLISTTCARLSPFHVYESGGQDGVHALCAGNLQSRLSNTIQRCWTTCEVF